LISQNFSEMLAHHKQKYLSVSQSAANLGSAELGASVAEAFGKGVGPLNQHLLSLSNISQSPMDGAKSLASQIAIKGFYAGEAAGIRLSTCMFFSPNLLLRFVDIAVSTSSSWRYAHVSSTIHTSRRVARPPGRNEAGNGRRTEQEECLDGS
jgi:hypothetical protein